MSRSALVQRVGAFAAPLLPPGSDVLVAVSGGSDSVALLSLLLDLRSALRLGRICVAHVNHGLRGEESDADEAVVSGMARGRGCALFVKRLCGRNIDAPGMEAWARAERYRFLREVASQQGFTRIATGHTADDQTETVLMRLVRGAGLRGLRGILARRMDGVVRPLLAERREGLRQYLHERGLDYRSDSSNTDRRFARNRLRLDILPVLRSLDPACIESLPATALAVQELYSRMYLVVNKWIAAHVLIPDSSRILVPRTAFEARWLAAEGVAAIVAGAGINPTRKHVVGIVGLGLAGNGRLLLPRGLEARGTRQGVEIVEGQGLQEAAPAPVPVVVPGTTRCEGGVEFSAVLEPWAGSDSAVQHDGWSACLDLAGPPDLVYRRCEEGEEFWPFGWFEPVKLRAFLKAQRVPVWQRQRIGVVVQEGLGVVWVPGLRTSERCRVTPQSRQVVKICCRPQGQY